MNKHDIEELQAFLQGEYIEESTSRSLKEVKQSQKQKVEHSEKTDKALFHKLVKSKMKNAVSSDVRKGSIEIRLKKLDCKTKSDMDNFSELRDCIKQLLSYRYETYGASVINKYKNKMFEIIGMNSLDYDVYLNNTEAGNDYIKICIFKSTGRNRVFGKVGYRFFHFTSKQIPNNKINPTPINDRGKTRLYSDMAVFFMAVKCQDAKKILTTTKSKYGDYVYEYIPKKSDTFYEDLYNNTDHASISRSNKNLDGMMIPVFILTKKPLVVKDVYQNLKSIEYLETLNDDKYDAENQYLKNKHDMYKRVKRSKPDGLILNPQSTIKHIKNSKTDKDLIQLSILYEFDETYDILHDLSEKKISLEEAKQKILQFITDEISNQSDDLREFKDMLKEENYDNEQYQNDINRKIDREIIRKRKHIKRYPAFESYIDEDNGDYISESVDAYEENESDYISEATSRSLKEVKQYQQKQSKNKTNVDLAYVKKFARKYCTHFGKRRNTRWGMYIERSECKTDKDITAFEYLKNILGSDQSEKVKINKFVKLIGLEGYRIDMLIGDDITVDNDHIELSFQLMTEHERVNPIGRIFIHTTDVPNLDHLNPKEGNSAGTRTYPGKASFFWAIKANNVNEALRKIPNRYGRYNYQYIPTGREDIFLDVLHNRISVKITDDVIPVFIQRNSAIPVQLIKESYIDETIERFDAFMEEFNNEQIGDSEFIMESAQDDKYAKITQDYIKKSGRSYFRYKKGEDTLPPEVEARIFDLAHKIIDFNDKGNFNQYKAYYDAFCKLVHHPNNTCIMGASINNIDDGYINLGILSNRKTAQRCPLKPGMHVYTTSNNPTLTTLDPYHFKGEPNSIRKTRSKNKMPGNDTYYAFPRAYFYVESFGSRYGGNTSKIQYDAKGIPIINNSDKGYGHLYMYTVKAGDQFYFDPELNDTGIIGRAVFMFVKKPVKLIKIY